MSRKFLAALAALPLVAAVPASAAPFVVDAFANSSTGGVGLASIVLTAGQKFRVSSSTDDLWSAGPLPRYSDGNGLTGDRFATATDDSGQPVGTQIGQNFGTWTQNGFASSYGSLVGELNGAYTLLGANGTFTAGSAGTLNLYFWDSNNGDNSGDIRFNISAVPEPAAWGLMIVGFALTAAALRTARRRELATA